MLAMGGGVGKGMSGIHKGLWDLSCLLQPGLDISEDFMVICIKKSQSSVADDCLRFGSIKQGRGNIFS